MFSQHASKEAFTRAEQLALRLKEFSGKLSQALEATTKEVNTVRYIC